MQKLQILIFTVLITSFSLSAQMDRDSSFIEDEILLNWQPTFTKALKKSKQENKAILIYFTGSDWCSPCKVLDKKLFHTAKFKELAHKDLILYVADNPRNRDLITEKQSKENIVVVTA